MQCALGFIEYLKEIELHVSIQKGKQRKGGEEVKRRLQKDIARGETYYEISVRFLRASLVLCDLKSEHRYNIQG